MLAAVFLEGGNNVSEMSIRRTMASKFNVDLDTASRMLAEAKDHLRVTDLATITEDIDSGAGDKISLNPTWKPRLQKQLTVTEKVPPESRLS